MMGEYEQVSDLQPDRSTLRTTIIANSPPHMKACYGVIAYVALLTLSEVPLFGGADHSTAPGEIDRLKLLLRMQQEEIDELRARLDAQQKLLEKILPASTSAQAPERTGEPASSAAQAPETSSLRDSTPVRAPLFFKLGGVSITPTGFLDSTQIWRSKTVTSGLPTAFAAIPFNNTVLGHRRHTLSSAAMTRMGMRVDTRVLGFDVLGLVETDFLGYVPNNVATTTNSNGLRLRLAFADLRKNRVELVAGQSWSLLTPSRKGISPLPDTLFITQDVDPNIQSGLVWGRIPQLRFIFHASESVAMALSFESADTYAGGSAGSGTITLTSALAPDYFGQVDLSTQNGNNVPNPNTDWIAKIAFDPKGASRSMHFEVAGMLNRFAFFNPLNNRTFKTSGGAVAVNAGIELVRHLTLFTNNFYTRGGGSHIFGEAPDLIIQGDGAPSLLPAASTVDGLEYEATPKWRFWAYYGGTWIGRASTIDPVTLQPAGYGYTGSPNSQNRTIQEVSGGFNRTFWNNPNYGSVRFHGQYSWLVRHPWFVAQGQPASANLNMVYLGLRYFLPGAPPASK